MGDREATLSGATALLFSRTCEVPLSCLRRGFHVSRVPEWLIRIEPVQRGCEKRTYECPDCGRRQSLLIPRNPRYEVSMNLLLQQSLHLGIMTASTSARPDPSTQFDDGLSTCRTVAMHARVAACTLLPQRRTAKQTCGSPVGGKSSVYATNFATFANGLSVNQDLKLRSSSLLPVTMKLPCSLAWPIVV